MEAISDILKMFEESYRPEEIRELYDNLSLVRKDLVNPYILSDDEYSHMWEEIKVKEKKRLEQRHSTIK